MHFSVETTSFRTAIIKDKKDNILSGGIHQYPFEIVCSFPWNAIKLAGFGSKKCIFLLLLLSWPSTPLKTGLLTLGCFFSFPLLISIFVNVCCCYCVWMEAGLTARPRKGTKNNTTSRKLDRKAVDKSWACLGDWHWRALGFLFGCLGSAILMDA